ncbi:hypothetical protein ACP4OV_020808 [Aristida adscensionis]
MGPLKSGCFPASCRERGHAHAPPSSTPPSPPSKIPPPPPPPPPPRRPHSPLPPPPPLPPGFVPLSLPSPRPPLPPPCGHPAPPRHGPTPPAAAAQPYSASAPSSSSAGGGFVEHLGGGPPPGTVPGEEEGEGGALAGVAPGMLPLKKRVVRYHPYAAAWAIQEIAAACRGGGGGGSRAADAGGGSVRDHRREEDDDAPLRAELARLRVPRPALVLTKRLTATDRSHAKARLLLPDALVGPSPLLGMLTAAERRLVLDGGGRGLPVPALDRLGRAYRMSLRRDAAARSYRLAGQWPLFLSRHGGARAGDAVEVRAFRPPAWQARLERHGEGGLGVALLHCRCRSGAGDDDHRWSSRERDAADGLLLIAAAAATAPCRRSLHWAVHSLSPIGSG